MEAPGGRKAPWDRYSQLPDRDGASIFDGAASAGNEWAPAASESRRQPLSPVALGLEDYTQAGSLKIEGLPARIGEPFSSSGARNLSDPETKLMEALFTLGQRSRWADSFVESVLAASAGLEISGLEEALRRHLKPLSGC